MKKEIQNIVQNFLDTEGSQFDVEVLKSGHINDTFKVSLEKEHKIKHFIVQKLNTSIFPEPQKIMENIETVAQHLTSKGYEKAILACLKTKKGEYFYQDTEGGNLTGFWRMIPFIENTYSILKVENVNQAFEAAKAFGEYLKYLEDLDVSKIHTIIPNFHNAAFRAQQFREALKNKPTEERLKKAHNALIFTEERINYYSQIIENIPLRVTHNDTKISNILFDKTTQKAACIIDLDTLQPSTLLSDFGDMVRTYTPQYDEDERDFEKVEMRLPYFEALMEGFLSELDSVLTPSEKASLIFGAKRTVYVQALRFLTDYLNNDIYYKTDYAEHNLARAENQIALLKSIEKQESKLH